MALRMEVVADECRTVRLWTFLSVREKSPSILLKPLLFLASDMSSLLQLLTDVPTGDIIKVSGVCMSEPEFRVITLSEHTPCPLPKLSICTRSYKINWLMLIGLLLVNKVCQTSLRC